MKRNNVKAAFPQYRTAAKTVLLTGAALAITVYVLAQTSPPNAGTALTNADNAVRGYFNSAANIMYAVGGIVGCVGAVKVYNKWNSGDGDTGKVAAAWFGSCIFLAIVAAAIKTFFGIT